MNTHSDITNHARGIGVLAQVCGGLFGGRAQSPPAEVSRLSAQRELAASAFRAAA